MSTEASFRSTGPKMPTPRQSLQLGSETLTFKESVGQKIDSKTRNTQFKSGSVISFVSRTRVKVSRK